MSVKKNKSKPIGSRNTKQVIENFDPERLKAPFLLRVGAILIDYILLIMIPVASMLLSRFLGDDGAKLIYSEINNTGWLIMILFGLTNFVILPIFSGQSIGKMLTGIRIVNADGTNPSFTALLLRHLIGYPITISTFGIGLFISFFNDKGRAFHDFLAGTVVVYGRRKIEKKLVESKKVRKLKSGKTNQLAVEGSGQQVSSP
jgi:uncharacterized RDD family membrane protein YckC